MSELKERILAGQLRKKFEGHPAPSKIAARMTDDELVARYHRFTDDAVAYQQSKTNVVISKSVPVVPLNELFKKALEKI